VTLPSPMSHRFPLTTVRSTQLLAPPGATKQVEAPAVSDPSGAVSGLRGPRREGFLRVSSAISFPDCLPHYYRALVGSRWNALDARQV